MNSNQDTLSFQFLEFDTWTPIRRGCKNLGGCYCTGECQEIIGYLDENESFTPETPAGDAFELLKTILRMLTDKTLNEEIITLIEKFLNEKSH